MADVEHREMPVDLSALWARALVPHGEEGCVGMATPNLEAGRSIARIEAQPDPERARCRNRKLQHAITADVEAADEAVVKVH